MELATPKTRSQPNSCPLCRQGQDTAIHLFVNSIEVKKSFEYNQKNIAKDHELAR